MLSYLSARLFPLLGTVDALHIWINDQNQGNHNTEQRDRQDTAYNLNHHYCYHDSELFTFFPESHKDVNPCEKRYDKYWESYSLQNR